MFWVIFLDVNERRALTYSLNRIGLKRFMQERQPNLGRELAETNANDEFVALLPFGSQRTSNKLEKALGN